MVPRRCSSYLTPPRGDRFQLRGRLVCRSVMETSKRRSRMRRINSGKRVELTERDIELFNLLNLYHYLRSTFLYAFLGGRSETRFKERLGHLYHDGGYVNRPAQQLQFANCPYMAVI